MSVTLLSPVLHAGNNGVILFGRIYGFALVLFLTPPNGPSAGLFSLPVVNYPASNVTLFAAASWTKLLSDVAARGQTTAR